MGVNKVKTKKSIKYLSLAAITCLAVGMMVACTRNESIDKTSDDSNNLQIIDAPAEAVADFWNMTWQSVECATSYVVRAYEKTSGKIVLTETSTEETKFDLYEYLLPETSYILEIKACGDGENIGDSVWVAIEYETEKITPLEYFRFLYISETDSYKICGKDKKFEGKIVLPDTYDGKPITHLGDLRPSNGVMGPSGTQNYTEIRLPLGLEVIGMNAFRECTALVQLKLPKTLKTIENSAFRECTSLKEIIASKDLDGERLTIADEAFKDASFESEEVKPLMLGGTLYAYAGRLKGEVRLEKPNNAKRILGYLFQNQGELEKVTLGASWGELSAYMFCGCNNLTEVVLEDGITKVGDCAFYACKSLQKLSIPVSVAELGFRVFWNCSSLETVVIPTKLTEIKDGMFLACKSLKEIVVPQKVKKIGEDAFNGCTALSTLILPEGLEEVGGSSFTDTASLKTLKLPSTLKGSVEIINSGVQSLTIPEGVTDICVKGCAELKEITLGKSVKTLRYGAFKGCKSLKKVQLPMGLRTILGEAFMDCGIEEVVIPVGVDQVAHNAFGDNVKRIFYHGAAQKEFERIFLYYISFTGNFPSEVALPIYFYSHSEPPQKVDGKGYDGNYWRYVDGIPTVWERKGTEVEPARLYACKPHFGDWEL